MSPPPRAHQRNGFAHAIDRSENIDADLGRQFVVPGLFDPMRVVEGGVVDKDVEAAERFHRGGEDRANGIWIADVPRKGERPVTQTLSFLAQQAGRPGDKNNIRIGLDKRLGDLNAKTTSRAGDERCLTAQ